MIHIVKKIYTLEWATVMDRESFYSHRQPTMGFKIRVASCGVISSHAVLA